jgi:hypothetical protein
MISNHSAERRSPQGKCCPGKWPSMDGRRKLNIKALNMTLLLLTYSRPRLHVLSDRGLKPAREFGARGTQNFHNLCPLVDVVGAGEEDLEFTQKYETGKIVMESKLPCHG